MAQGSVRPAHGQSGGSVGERVCAAAVLPPTPTRACARRNNTRCLRLRVVTLRLPPPTTPHPPPTPAGGWALSAEAPACSAPGCWWRPCPNGRCVPAASSVPQLMACLLAAWMHAWRQLLATKCIRDFLPLCPAPRPCTHAHTRTRAHIRPPTRAHPRAQPRAQTWRLSGRLRAPNHTPPTTRTHPHADLAAEREIARS